MAVTRAVVTVTVLFAWCHFPVLECVMQRLSAATAAQWSAHAEGRPSQVADRSIIISYSLERCWSPSAPKAPRTQPHKVSVLIRIQTCRKSQEEMLLLQPRVTMRLSVHYGRLVVVVVRGGGSGGSETHRRSLSSQRRRPGGPGPNHSLYWSLNCDSRQGV